jgi:hypothetical protein
MFMMFSVSRLEQQEGYREEIIQYTAMTQQDKYVQYGVEMLLVVDYAIYQK